MATPSLSERGQHVDDHMPASNNGQRTKHTPGARPKPGQVNPVPAGRPDAYISSTTTGYDEK